MQGSITDTAHHVDSGVFRTQESSSSSSLRSVCAELHARVETFLEQDVEDEVLRGVQTQTRISLGVLEEALDRYGLEHLSFSYNGGKDCLVLLILFLVAIHAHYTRLTTSTSTSKLTQSTPPAAPQAFPTHLRSIYIIPPNPFPQVDIFVQSSSAAYQLSLSSSTLPMKAAFADYVDRNPDVTAIFVGTRRTDPHGGDLTHFDATDRGWPAFMRVHPVIDWHYREIWGFIRYLDIPYCPLYDMGYTSLGGTTDTHPNPALRAEGGEGNGYRPAHELVEDDEERLGRDH